MLSAVLLERLRAWRWKFAHVQGKMLWIYLAFGQLPAVASVLYGIKPAVTAIVLFAAYRIGSGAIEKSLLWTMAALAFLAIFVLHAPFPLIVLAVACSASSAANLHRRNSPLAVDMAQSKSVTVRRLTNLNAEKLIIQQRHLFREGTHSTGL